MTYKRSREVHFRFRGRGAKIDPLSRVREEKSATVKAWRKSLKRRGPRVGKDAENIPRAAVFCHLSQVHILRVYLASNSPLIFTFAGISSCLVTENPQLCLFTLIHQHSTPACIGQTQHAFHRRRP